MYLSSQTIETIILGITVFIITSAIINYFSYRFKFRLGTIRFYEKNYTEVECISESIPAWKIIIVLILELLSLFLVLAFLISNFGTNISAAIYAFRLRSMNITSSDYVSLPGFVRLIRRIALAAGYIVMYLFFNGIPCFLIPGKVIRSDR